MVCYRRTLAFLALTFLGFLTPSHKASASQWWDNRTFYQIFVGSYQDSNGDGFGDLAGITSRLDYLSNPSQSDQSLGVKAIWLTPFFSAPSYHGYDTTDYYSVDPKFGTLDDFKILVHEAHKRDIKIVVDLVVNHTSDKHPWFVNSKSSQNSKYRDWYTWASKPPHWGKWHEILTGFYYAVFDRSMPNLNWKNPLVLEEVISIIDFWKRLRVDGFRLDAARYYVPGPNGEHDTPETHKVIEQFAEETRRRYPDTMFIGEIWSDKIEDINAYCESGLELDAAFAFPLAFPLHRSLNSESVREFGAALVEFSQKFKKISANAPFLTNHDLPRLASMLYEYAPKVRLAAEILFSLPGTPFVYYGEELGMPSTEISGDYAHRQPMQWVDDPGYGFTGKDVRPVIPFLGQGERFNVHSQSSSPNSILNLYRRLIRFRSEHPALSLGNLSQIRYDENRRMIFFTRQYGSQKLLVALNFSYLPSNQYRVDWLEPTDSVTKIYPTSKKISGQLIPSLPPHSMAIFEIR